MDMLFKEQTLSESIDLPMWNLKYEKTNWLYLIVDLKDFQLTKIVEALLSVNATFRDEVAVGVLVLAGPVDGSNTDETSQQDHSHHGFIHDWVEPMPVRCNKNTSKSRWQNRFRKPNSGPKILS